MENKHPANINVATVLTVYGIETQPLLRYYMEFLMVATVLTVYGIETVIIIKSFDIL